MTVNSYIGNYAFKVGAQRRFIRVPKSSAGIQFVDQVQWRAVVRIGEMDGEATVWFGPWRNGDLRPKDLRKAHRAARRLREEWSGAGP